MKHSDITKELDGGFSPAEVGVAVVVGDEVELGRLTAYLSEEGFTAGEYSEEGALLKAIGEESVHLLVAHPYRDTERNIRFLTSVKLRDPNLEVLYLTDSLSMEERWEALTKGAFEYLHSGIKKEQLLNAIKDSWHQYGLNLSMARLIGEDEWRDIQLSRWVEGNDGERKSRLWEGRDWEEESRYQGKGVVSWESEVRGERLGARVKEAGGGGREVEVKKEFATPKSMIQNAHMVSGKGFEKPERYSVSSGRIRYIFIIGIVFVLLFFSGYIVLRGVGGEDRGPGINAGVGKQDTAGGVLKSDVKDQQSEIQAKIPTPNSLYPEKKYRVAKEEVQIKEDQGLKARETVVSLRPERTTELMVMVQAEDSVKPPEVQEPLPENEMRDPRFEKVYIYRCVASKVNVRDGPGTNFLSLGHIHKGDKVLVIEKSVPWYMVEAEGIGIGFVYSKYLYPMIHDYRIYRCSGSNVNVRNGPGTNYPRLGHLHKGDKVLVIEESGSWYKVRVDGIGTGFVYGEYLHTDF